MERRDFLKLGAGALTYSLVAEPVWAQTNKIEVHWLGQATTKITTLTGKVIVIDPFMVNNPKTPVAYKNLDAIHVVSPGAIGAVKLGNTWLTQTDLPIYQNDLRDWGAALAPNAEILLYGCDAAANQAGEFCLTLMQPGDVVLVKGSRGVHLEKVTELLQSSAVRSAL